MRALKCILHRYFLIALLLFLSVNATSIAFAEAPTPARKLDAIGSFDKKIQNKKQEQKQLAERAEKIEDELTDLQGSLVKLANSMRKNEETLSELDTQISKLEKDQSGLSDQLVVDQDEMADLIMALQRLRRLPPEALLARPDAPLKTAQSAMLLQNTLPSLYEKAQRLRGNLEKNKALTQELRTKRDKAKETSKALEAEHSKLMNLAQKRKILYRATRSNIDNYEQETIELAQQAKSLKELVQNLDEQRRRRTARESAAQSLKTIALKVPAFIGDSLKPPRLPISGIIKTRYKELDHFGAPSQGIDIEGRGGAVVVAPMAGTVRYSGHFKNYGNVVIIEHGDGYHSLVAGLANLEAIVGQDVLVGEPIGLLHYGRNEEKPVLYYELRYNGKAVDPARKFSDLG